jgi:hypothetical protein
MGVDPESRFGPPDGLIVVHEGLAHPLWDQGAAAFADQIEERLDGVFVTSADLGSRPPRVRDAVRAAWFMGCRSPVVVVGDRATARRIADEQAGLRFKVAVAPEWSPDAIAATFRGEVAHAAQRACA